MKLLYITNGITGSGGLERVLSVKASALAEDYGYDVVIATLNEENHQPFYQFSPKLKFVTFHAKGNPFRYVFQYRKSIKELIKKVKPDVISVCDDGLKGFFIPKIIGSKIPIIYERHASQLINLGALKKNSVRALFVQISFKLMRQLSKDFDEFVVLTNGNLKEWPNSHNVKVIENPLSFNSTESALLTTKKVIAVGTQSYHKGYDLLLKIWQKTQSKDGWELHVFGKKDLDLGLEELRNKLNLQETVFFHSATTNIESEYLDSSIFVLSSRNEGFGMVIIEAMACGLPVISFDCPHGPADIITDGEDGFLIENGNIVSYSEKLELLINNFELRKRMGKNGKENVKKYMPENIIKQWDSLFKKLVQNSR